MNRFAETAAFWRDRELCPGCGEITVSRRGQLCWRCTLWESERGRAFGGLFWGGLAGALLWVLFLWLINRIGGFAP